MINHMFVLKNELFLRQYVLEKISALQNGSFSTCKNKSSKQLFPVDIINLESHSSISPGLVSFLSETLDDHKKTFLLL